MGPRCPRSELQRRQAATSFSGHEGPPLTRGTMCSVVGLTWAVKARPHQTQVAPSRSRAARRRAGRSSAIPAIVRRGAWGRTRRRERPRHRRITVPRMGLFRNPMSPSAHTVHRPRSRPLSGARDRKRRPVTQYDQYQPAPPPGYPSEQPAYGQPGYQPQKTNTMAILGLVFAFVFSPLGIVFSAIGLKQIKQRREGGRGLALAGVIISIISVVLGILFLVLAATVFSSAVEQAAQDSATVSGDDPD